MGMNWGINNVLVNIVIYFVRSFVAFLIIYRIFFTLFITAISHLIALVDQESLIFLRLFANIKINVDSFLTARATYLK